MPSERPGRRPELAAAARFGPRIAGCDEAGRGPLAGPVVAAAVIVPDGLALAGLDDSKQLDAEQRLRLFQVVRSTCAVGVGVASAAEIDRLNILQASLTAMRRAVVALDPAPDAVLVDGNQPVPGLHCGQQTLVGGDGRSVAIAAASIVAKVVRDTMMERLDRLYPGYGFAAHKGYPCPPHLAALQALGPCPVHRTCYAPVRALLAAPPPLPPTRRRPASLQLSLFAEPAGE